MGATMGILSGTYQEYLGCSPMECRQGRDLLKEHGDGGGHREPLTWRVCKLQGVRVQMTVREGAGAGVVGEIIVGGCPQAPTVRLRRTAEVTPTGVGIRAVGHPRQWGSLQTSGTGAEGRIHPGPLPGP